MLVRGRPENGKQNLVSGFLSAWELKGSSPYLVLVSEWADPGRFGGGGGGRGGGLKRFEGWPFPFPSPESF